MIIFRAKSTEAYCIKILAELLANNLKSGCFEIDEDGMKLTMMDNHRKILIDLSLNSINFSVYKFNNPEKMYIGLNLSHLHRTLKSLKKKDVIEFYITSEDPTDLNIQVIPKDNARVTTSIMKIQNIQTLDISIPDGYGKPIIISSSEYSKMLKDLGSLGNNIKGNIIKIISKNRQIEFSCNSAGILKRRVKFGEIEEDDIEESSSENKVECYNEEFPSDLLSKITKLAGLSSQIQVYIGRPLLLVSNIGNLGKISVYIKSKNEIESQIISDEESEDEI
jgi:proliferating cell nuclear antigen PCNA